MPPSHHSHLRFHYVGCEMDGPDQVGRACVGRCRVGRVDDPLAAPVMDSHPPLLPNSPESACTRPKSRRQSQCDVGRDGRGGASGPARAMGRGQPEKADHYTTNIETKAPHTPSVSSSWDVGNKLLYYLFHHVLQILVPNLPQRIGQPRIRALNLTCSGAAYVEPNSALLLRYSYGGRPVLAVMNLQVAGTCRACDWQSIFS